MLNKNGKINNSCWTFISYPFVRGRLKSSSEKPQSFSHSVHIKQDTTGYTYRWDSSLFIDSKSSAAQASGDGRWALGSACFCASSLQYICDAGTDERGFLYASFTLKTHRNSVVFQGFQSDCMNHLSQVFLIWLTPPPHDLMNDDCTSVWLWYYLKKKH